MSNQPRNINMNQARSAGSGQPGASRPAAQRPMYDQAAGARSQSSTASGQIRHTASSAQSGMYSSYGQPRQPQPAPTQRVPRQTPPQQYYTTSGTAGTAPRAQQAAPTYRAQPQGSRPASGGYSRSGAQQNAYGSAPSRTVPRGYAGASGTAARGYSAPSNTAARGYAAGSGAASRSYSASAGAAPRSAQTSGYSRKKKKNAHSKTFLALAITLCVVLASVIGLNMFAGSIVNTGDEGHISQEIQTPPQFRDQQLSVLVLGIDYSTEDAVKRSENGNTDMIMYMRFDFVNNSIKMLQIPRDTFVGADQPTGGTGKINGLYANGPDRENRVDNLAKVINDQLKLPIDKYVTIDMDSLREIVDTFGGIEVYVPQDMSYDGSSLTQGWHNLMGAECEYFLRDRKSFATGDIKRLENQRYFYSALFRKVRTATWQDIVKLTPVVQKYIHTNIPVTDCMGLAIKLLKIPSANIMMCRLPVYDGAERYKGQSVQVAGGQETADLLNEYFRTPEAPVAASELGLAQWATAGAPHPANVQWMGDIDAEGGGQVGTAADATQTGDDVIAQSEAQQSAQSTAAA